jgi:predicted nucleic acid-binding protein
VTQRELRENMQAMQPWCRASTTAETALLGLAIHQRFKFSFYDATLIAAAVSFGCDYFLSEDLGHNQNIGSMRVINPFASEPDTVLEKN